MCSPRVLCFVVITFYTFLSSLSLFFVALDMIICPPLPHEGEGMDSFSFSSASVHKSAINNSKKTNG